MKFAFTQQLATNLVQLLFSFAGFASIASAAVLECKAVKRVPDINNCPKGSFMCSGGGSPGQNVSMPLAIEMRFGSIRPVMPPSQRRIDYTYTIPNLRTMYYQDLAAETTDKINVYLIRANLWNSIQWNSALETLPIQHLATFAPTVSGGITAGHSDRIPIPAVNSSTWSLVVQQSGSIANSTVRWSQNSYICKVPTEGAFDSVDLQFRP